MGSARGRRRGGIAVLGVAAAAACVLGLAGCAGPVDGVGSPPSAAETHAPPESPDPAAAGPALASLLSAEIPSLCEHGEGRLEAGALPGIAEGQGRVQLHPDLRDAAASGEEESPYAAAGETASGDAFIAAALVCDRGGVSWPDQVVVWDGEGAVVGVFDPATITGGDREAVAGLSALPGGFSARWIGANDLDAACCGQLSAEAEVGVAPTGLEVGQTETHRGEAQVAQLARAVAAGERPSGFSVPDEVVQGLAAVHDRFDGIDPDGVGCADARPYAGDATLACAIPVRIGAETRSFIVYTSLTGWNEYDVVQHELELW